MCLAVDEVAEWTCIAGHRQPRTLPGLMVFRLGKRDNPIKGKNSIPVAINTKFDMAMKTDSDRSFLARYISPYHSNASNAPAMCILVNQGGAVASKEQ